ncbi:MAG: Xaa-Pro peptidase family protein [Ignavibacteriaceae bacterium]
MNNEIIKEKTAQAIEILKEKNIDMWLTFVKESSIIHDPSLDIILGMNLTWHSAVIINKDGETTLILGDLEKDSAERTGIYKNIIPYTKSIKDILVNYLKKKNPNKIAINYSLNSSLADGLSHGLYLTLADYLKGTGYENKLVSSEEIISAVKGRKSATELKIMREAIKETLKIFNEVTSFIQPGKTEKDVAAFVKGLVEKRGFKMAWDEDHCPSVFTGPNPASAHSGPSDRKIEKGHMVNMDFGIKLNGYCSDLQRTWYLLKDDEEKAPANVQKGFEIIRDSIQKVAGSIKPGVKGVDMDKIARDYIVQSGYVEYPHGLGHQVGTQVHDGGAGLYPAWEKYGNTPFLELEENMVLTVEPRLPVEGYGVSTLEEEIVVTKKGCEFLSDVQKELWLIKTK